MIRFDERHITKLSSKENINRGRPRSAETDTAILEAALRLMARAGYPRMSMDALAAEAGVTKPTIYLRYPRGKAQVAAAALAHLRERSTVEETGETRADLVLHLERFRRGVERPNGMAMIGSVLAEEHETPELLAEFRANVVAPRRKLLRGVLERARARGELRPDTDLDAAVNMAVGAYYAQYLAGDPFAPDWAERIVDEILAGLRGG